MIEESQEDPELLKPMNMYMEDNFKEYVKEKYFVENDQLLNNPTIMQMVYALEWYDIPRSAYSELIEFHPYLTVGDHDKVYYVKMQHRIENLISFSLFALLSNRILKNKVSLFKRRVTRFPAVAAISGGLTYLFNTAILRPIYLNDLEAMGLTNKYFYLDLNADMMKDDLE